MRVENGYYLAVEAKTEAEADVHFDKLVHEAMVADPRLTQDHDHAKEVVVAGLCSVSIYYGAETRRRVMRLYSHRSPYRNGSIAR